MYLWLERHKSADTMRRKKGKLGGGNWKYLRLASAAKGLIQRQSSKSKSSWKLEKTNVPVACGCCKRADTETELKEQEFVDTERRARRPLSSIICTKKVTKKITQITYFFK